LSDSDQPSQPARKHDPLEALRQPAFAFYSGSRIFSTLGQQMLQAVMAWQVYQITGSALSLGLLGLARFLPALSLSMIGGAVADTFDRRRIVQCTGLVPFFCALTLAFSTAGGWITIELIYGLVVLIGLASAFEAPARTALLTGIVRPETFANAVTVNNIFQKLGSVTGPTVGGVIIATAGVSTAYAAFCGCAAIAWIALGLIPYRQERSTRARPGVREIKEGISYVRERQEILGAMTLDMFAVIFGGAAALLPIYATDVLHAGPGGYGILTSSMQVGALITSLGLVMRPQVERNGRALLLSVVGFGIATVLFGVSREFVLSVFFYGLIGAFDQISVVMRQTIVQLGTPDELRGRVSAVNQVFVQASSQIGGMESGFAAALGGATFAVVSGGIVSLAVAGLVGVFLPAVWRNRLSDSTQRVAEHKQRRESAEEELVAAS
jgi:MFS family permease